MDFGSVLYTAQKNDETSRQSNGWYKTGFAPPKKEQREKKLSPNVQQFLARKEAEERQKKLEAERKKQELLALRSQDKKSLNRVQSMLKRTKSANKAVIEDAIDHDNTAVTAAGILQPDDDDYGYVSKDAEKLYNKLVYKYTTMPSEDSWKKKSLTKTAKDISTTKDRVKAALQREEEEKLLPRKRKRKSKDSEANQVSEAEHSDDGGSPEKVDEKPKSEKFKIPKKNTQAPPPIDFQSLLKLAEKKQYEPIIIEKPIEEKPERPMTQKEKLEYMRERERKMRREMKVTNTNKPSEPSTKKPKLDKPSFTSSTESKSQIKIHQKDHSEPASNVSQKTIRKSPSNLTPRSQSEKPVTKVTQSEKPKVENDRATKPIQKPAPNVRPKNSTENNEQRDKFDKSKSQTSNAISEKKKAFLMKKAREQYYAQQRRNATSTRIPNEREDQSRIKAVKKPPSQVSENRDPKSADRKTVPSVSRDSSVKKVPSREGVREFPPRDMVRQFPPPDVIKKKPAPKPVRRRVIESDDEYDSEMDDFIDDSEDPNDVSRYISEIFGNYRSKYAGIDNEDEDDECMESNFADLQKEEYRSLRTAIEEDLEDVRRTKLEKLKKKRPVSRY